MKKKIIFLVKVLSIGFMAGILLSYLSITIHPHRFAILPFFGLFYPYFFFINLFFLLFWASRKNKISILILLILLLGWKQMGKTFQPFPELGKHKENKIAQNSSSKKLPDKHSETRVLTYNVHLFNLFNVGKNGFTPEEMINFIAGKEANIICLQEIYFSGKSGLTPEILKKKFHNTPYSYIQFSNPGRSDRRYGMAIFSAFPIIHRGKVRYNNTFNLSIFADIVMGRDTIRVFNNHLQSFRLGTRNFNFLSSPTGKNSEAFEDIQDISLRMRSAFVKRAGQADILSRNIQEAPYPVIVSGDFNDTPVSYTYHKLCEGLKDAFIESGKGFGKTYSQIFPSYRIDYILFSPKMTSSDFHVIKTNYSDHFPVYCTLSY